MSGLARLTGTAMSATYFLLAAQAEIYTAIAGYAFGGFLALAVIASFVRRGNA